MTVAVAIGAPALSEHDEGLVRLCATNLLELLPDLGVAMARHIHEQVPELGGVQDAASLEATRKSCVANMREMCIMLRAGLPATAHETPADALEYVRFLRTRGVALSSVLRAYRLGVSMFLPVVGAEFGRCADSAQGARRMLDHAGAFVWVYIDRVTERLAAEYGGERGEHLPELDDPVWAEPTSLAAAQAFIATHDSQQTAAVSHARATAQAALRSFQARIQAAADNERLANRLAVANTSVRIELADEPDLAIALLLDSDGVRVVHGDTPTETVLSLSSVDLERLRSDHFNLPMAIARGRVAATGPVRKFLRVMPIVRALPDPDEPPVEAAAGTLEERLAWDRADAGLQFDAATQDVLDRAAAHEPHDRSPAGLGHLWSIELRDVSTAVGADQVLDGLTLGIPEGMITVVLGPSGRAKSVLLSHFIGLTRPDSGEVLVHGRPTAGLRSAERAELQRRFGVVFADGGLSEAMNVFDNVAYPLRRHTDLSERQVAEIVDERLAEVGLGGAGDRRPGALSMGMRKRAGFAQALALDPEVVLFDEPDAGHDPVRAALPCELIQQLHAEHGGTYVVLTHDVATARRLADYLVVLWHGRTVQAGDRDDMFTSPNPFVRQFLAGSVGR